MGEVRERFGALLAQVRGLGLEFPEWEGISTARAHEMLEAKFGFAVHEDLADWFGFTYGCNYVSSQLMWSELWIYDYGSTSESQVTFQKIVDDDLEEWRLWPDIPFEFDSLVNSPYVKLLLGQRQWVMARNVWPDAGPPTMCHVFMDGLEVAPFLMPRADGVVRECTLPEFLAQRQHDFRVGHSFVEPSEERLFEGGRYRGYIEWASNELHPVYSPEDVVALVGSGRGAPDG